MTINEVDKIEILTLQDNFIDLTMMDNNAVVTRAVPLDGFQFRRSVLAEHGFSALATITTGNTKRSMLFDFGFSKEGAAFNAGALNAGVGQVEALVLSHGHTDHTGGFEAMTDIIGKKGIPFIAHPGVFKTPRYLKITEDFKVHFPSFSRNAVSAAGLKLVETASPYAFLGGNVLFLGEIQRKTDFEKGFPIAYFQENGVEKWDPIEDDTAIVMNLKNKGLVVLSGCAHSGIINTVTYAKSVTGIDKVCAVMGGFHLSGPLFDPIIERTTQELKKINLDYVVPTHCTGRKAIMHIEKEMPDQFILNMSGTTLTFSA